MEELKMEDGNIRRYTPRVDFKCIYCGKTVTMAEFEDGTWGLLHNRPECPEFIAMDPLTFTRLNREKFERDIEEGGNN